MLTPSALEELLERLQALHSRRVPEAGLSLQSDQLAFLPWTGLEDALDAAVLHAVAFANHRGGDLIFGIHSDARIAPCPIFETSRFPREVFARTRPGILAEVWSYPWETGTLIVVSVPEDNVMHATADGLRVRRSGCENLPITPDQDAALVGTRGELDYSDRPLPGVTFKDIDPVQVLFLREILRRRNDQSELLELTDQELLRSLGLLDERGTPRVAGVLLLGHKALLQERLPQAEVAYLHLNEQDEADAQLHLCLPLLHTLSRLQDLIEARNRFTPMRHGMFLMQVRDFDEEVYREAIVNALVHRDYSRRDGCVHLVHRTDRLEISNPGGLVGGVSPENILYHPPRHRNRRLTEVLQQLGLMERAGMGVNRLYRFLLRKGKAPPEYDVTPESVRLVIEGGNMDEPFARFISDEESLGRVFTLDMLIILSALKRQKLLERGAAAALCQRTDRQVAPVVAKMLDLGYLERVGGGRGSAFRLSSAIHARLGSSILYFRDRGLSRRRQRALVLEVVEELGGISLEECQELCGVVPEEARALIQELVSEGLLLRDGLRFSAPAVG